MRDDQINRLHEMNVRRSMLLLDQLEFLMTRQRATELVLSTRAAMMKAAFDPVWLWRAVDNEQRKLLTHAKQQREAAMQKPVLAKA